MTRGVIIYYKNSVLASIFSVSASFMLIFGLVFLVESDWLTGVILIAISIAMLFLASYISKRKEFRKWVKKLKQDGIIDRLKTSEDLCVKMYNANPCRMTLNFIKRRNSDAADVIIARKKEVERIIASAKKRKGKAEKWERCARCGQLFAFSGKSLGGKHYCDECYNKKMAIRSGKG